MQFFNFFTTDISSRAYFNTHHVDKIVTLYLNPLEIKKKYVIAGLPKAEPDCLNEETGFPNGEPGFLNRTWISKRVTTFLFCEIELSGKNTYDDP